MSSRTVSAREVALNVWRERSGTVVVFFPSPPSGRSHRVNYDETCMINYQCDTVVICLNVRRYDSIHVYAAQKCPEDLCLVGLTISFCDFALGACLFRGL